MNHLNEELYHALFIIQLSFFSGYIKAESWCVFNIEHNLQ